MRKSSLYLPEKLKSALAARAAQSGRSEADLIRAALESSLAQPTASVASPHERPVAGRLVGVGVGPGEADLLTLRAVAALRRADRVLAPATAVDSVGRAEAIARQVLPGLAVERVPFAMAPTRAGRDRSIDLAATAVIGHLSAGEEVAWVTLGDPLTYSTFAAVVARVKRKRPSTEIVQVPGIMAFQALAAETGTVIADERTRVTVVTALDGQSLSADLKDPNTTVVVYKGGRRLPELAAEVLSARGHQRGAVAGELLGMPGQRIGALAELADAGPASYLATVIVPASPTPAGPRRSRK